LRGIRDERLAEGVETEKEYRQLKVSVPLRGIRDERRIVP
jgi:hypothetical protein